MKHVGRIENTGKRCIVVFREIYDETGKVIESDKCLVVETDSLPDFAHQDIMSIVESEPAQREGELFNVLARTRLSNGDIALPWLHSQGRLRKYDTNNVVLIPNSNTKIKLNVLNRIIELQKAGYSESDINRIISDMQSDKKVNQDKQTVSEQAPTDGALTDEDLAKNLLSQAETLKAEVERLENEAYTLAPSLKPTKRKRASSKSKETTTENV